MVTDLASKISRTWVLVDRHERKEKVKGDTLIYNLDNHLAIVPLTRTKNAGRQRAIQEEKVNGVFD